MRSTLACIAALSMLLAAPAARGGGHTLGECVEGSEFIANAARARDNGYPRDAFLARMEEDFVVIRAFPLPLRWFAKDPRDEAFLLAAAADVWDRPRPPDEHRAGVLAACLERATA